MEEFKKIFIVFLVLITSCDFKNLSTVQDEYFSEDFFETKTCIIGDTGTGSSDQYLIAKALEGENCKNIIHTGDLIYPNGLRKENIELFDRNFSNPYSELLKNSRFFLTLGNHDHHGDKYAYLDIIKNHPNIILPNFFYISRFKDACILFIDTTLNYRNGQEKWIKEKRKQLTNCPKVITVGHHPRISSGHHGNARGLIQKFLDENIIEITDLYISGHDHQLSIEKISGNKYQIISGSAAQVRPHRKNKSTIFAISDLGFTTIEQINGKKLIVIKTVDNSAVAQEAYRIEIQ